FNIRSTLYLPMTDAPWKREGGDEPLEGITLGPIDAAKEKTVVDTNFDGDSTVVMGRPHPADDVTATKVELAGALTTQKRLDARTEADKDPVPAGKALQMSALVPMRSDFDSLGVIFLENVRNLQGRDTAYSRQELDQFGAQLAIFLERKTRFDLRK